MNISGRYPDVTIPEVSRTAFIFNATHLVKERDALIDGPSGRAVSYGEFEDKVRRVAGNLAQRGFGKGDVFGIFSTNCPEYGIIFHAVAMLGGVNTTLNPLYTAEEAAFQLKDARARFLITAPMFIDKASSA